MQQCVIVDEIEVLATGCLNAKIVATCKAKILFAANDLDLWIALFNDSRFVLLGGIIYHDYLYRRIV